MRPGLAAALVILLAASLAAEEFIVDIEDNHVRFFNNGALFNCGSVIEVDLEVHCGTITLLELEQVIDPQYCTCPFDLIVDFTLGSGPYTLQVWRLEYWQEEPILVWVHDFEIMEIGVLSGPWVYQSGCGGWGPSSVPDELVAPETWSSIRALY